jgi:hypothetical protein
MLIFLSEKLSVNQGLMLQKSKTRIMSSSEFQSTIPSVEAEPTLPDETESIQDSPTQELSAQRQKLISFSLRFDPYSPTAAEDYYKLKEEIKKYDILELIEEELGKTRVHTALTKKLVRSIQYLEDSVLEQAVLSVLDNSEVLYPLYASILMMIDQVVDKLSDIARAAVKTELIRLIESESHVFKVDIHVCYAIRVLSILTSRKWYHYFKEYTMREILP